MNGQEQKERATAVALLRMDLTKMGEDLHTLLGVTLDAALKSDDNLRAEFGTILDCFRKELRDEFIESISAEGRARMGLADQQRRYVDDADRMLHYALKGFRESSWWSRIKWTFFKGRGF